MALDHRRDRLGVFGVHRLEVGLADQRLDGRTSGGVPGLGRQRGRAGLHRLQCQHPGPANPQQEILTAFSLARGDLENLSRTIALTARLVVQTRVTGEQGRLDYWESLFASGDRTAFTRLFGRGKRIRACLKAKDSMPLQHHVGLYIQLFESVLALSRENELRGMLLTLPLGRAYSALKIAVDQDPDGRYLHSLEHLPRDVEDA